MFGKNMSSLTGKVYLSRGKSQQINEDLSKNVKKEISNPTSSCD